MESSSINTRRERRAVRAFWPSAAAYAELTWFFNQALIAIDQPSNFLGLLTGESPTSLEALGRRAEALHSARKIYDWLKRLRPADVRLLSGLYTEGRWSGAVARALPGGLAGAARCSARVRLAYRCAVARGETLAGSVAEFIEEVVRSGRPALVAGWRADLAIACAFAESAYDRARGDGPSVVPEDDT